MRDLRLLVNDRPAGNDGQSYHPRCDHCSLPAICFGADLAAPKHRCPRCCRRFKQFGGFHGPDDYLGGHMAAEGCDPDGLPQEATDA